MSDATGGLATSLLLAFGDVVQPVLDAVESPEAMEYFWYELGWDVRLDDLALAAMEQALPLTADKQRIERAAAAVRAAVRSGSIPSSQQVADLAGVVLNLAASLTSFTPSALASLPAPLADAGTWDDAAEQLFDRLLEQYLRVHHPLLYALLRAAGCIDYQAQVPTGALRVPYTRVVLDWDQLGALFDHPLSALERAYHWNDPDTPFDHARLLGNLAAVLRTLGLSTSPIIPSLQLGSGLDAQTQASVHQDVDGLRVKLLQGLRVGQHLSYEVGADLFPGGPDPSAVPTGLVLRPRLLGSLSESVALGASLAVTTTVAADIGAALALELFPGATRLAGSDVAIGLAVQVAGAGTDPWLLVGTPGHARIEIRNPRLTIALLGSAEDPELRLTFATGPAIGSGSGSGGSGGGSTGCRVVIPLGEADALLHGSIGQSDVTIEFSPQIVWSSRTGLGINGNSVPQMTVPTNLRLGTFTVHALQIALGSVAGSNSHQALGLQVGFDVGGTIGPVQVSVQRLGFAVALTPYSRAELRALPPGAARPALGRLDVGLDFLPPIGAGLAIDASGIITGGGFLSHDPRTGLYAGVLQLTFQEQLTLTAIGLVSTQLPDGSPGYSVLILITAQNFPPIPLFLGFALTGIGGIVGVHRTIDQQAIEAGLHADTLKSVLFPADPIANAPAVIRALSSIFPPQRGSYLIGVMAQIGRQSPPINMDLAVIYEFGQQHRVVVLGRISADMPSATEDLVRLRLDAFGVVDLDAGTVAIDAMLFDSRLAYKYTLSGAMALRAGGGPNSAFVLAVGGFNPHFAAPPGVPALDRVAIALSSGENPRLRCEAYFALTSNTVQFGARAQLHAAAYGFAIDGDVGFDVLIQRSPFAFIAEFHASIALSYGTSHLFSVDVDGELQGPRPLVLRGSASFSVFWCDFTIGFDRTLITGQAPPLPAGPNPTTELVAALTDPRSWTVTRPANRGPGVTLRHRSLEGVVLADPLGDLVVTQNVLPLNTVRAIEVFAGAPLSPASSFTLSVSVAGLSQQTTVLDDFAPGDFFKMSDDERIAGPSFERLQTGVAIGAGAAAFDPTQIVAVDLLYRTLVVEDLDQPPVPLPDPYRPEPGRIAVSLQLGALQAAASRTTGRARFRNPQALPAATLATQLWAAVPETDDALGPDQVAAASTWSQTLAASRAQGAAPSAASGRSGQWQLVPVFVGAPS